MNDIVYLNVCLSDISASELTTSQKTGKTYVNLIAQKSKGLDRMGNNVRIMLATKQKTDKPIFVGNGHDYRKTSK